VTGTGLVERLLFVACFALATWLGRVSVLPDSDLALVWPAAGVAAARFAATGWSRLLIVDSVLVFLLVYVIDLATGMESSLALGLSIALVVQLLAFGALLSRWCPQWWGFGGRATAAPDSLRDFGILLAAGFGSALVSALVGPASVVAISGADVSGILSWVLRNGVGVVAIFPFALWLRRVSTGRPSRAPAPVGPMRARGPIELVALLAATAAAVLFIFVRDDLARVPFLLLATSVWVGARFAPLIAALHAVLLSSVVVVITRLDHGPFAAMDDPGLVAQAYLVMIVVLTYALAVGRREALVLSERLSRSERSATEQAAMVRTILDTMSDGVSVVAADGSLVLRNPAALELMGEVRRDASGAIDVSAYDLRQLDGSPIAPEDSPVATAMAGTAVEKRELYLRSPAAPDGLLVEVTARPLPESDPPLVVIVLHDVTAQRRERDELASFAGVVAHDLLNPLTVVDGWTEALLEDLRAGDPVEPTVGIDQLERIQRAAHRMQHLISDLLAFTTARDRSINPVRVDLESVVRDVARARIDASRVSDAPVPVIEVDGPLPDVLAEPVLLRQVIDNLVGNAVKYVAPGVRPEITVRARRIDSETAADALVEIEISDNGIGIPAGQHVQVFDSFHRAHLEGGYRGTGLGLSIVKRIAERHGGSASARDNDAGHGTTMTVSFPAAD